MSRIIKLHKDVETQSGPNMETEKFLSFDDFWQGNSVVGRKARPRNAREAAMEEAARIVREAWEQAESIRQEAWDKGEAEGRDKGFASGLARYEKQLADLAALFAALSGELDLVLRQHEESMLTLIITMVERLVHHEVSLNPQVIRACLSEAMELVVAESRVRVHLHADDLETLKKVEEENPQLFPGNNRVTLVEDRDVVRGGGFLRTDFGEVDATLDNRKARLFGAVEQAFIEALGEVQPGEKG